MDIKLNENGIYNIIDNCNTLASVNNHKTNNDARLLCNYSYECKDYRSEKCQHCKNNKCIKQKSFYEPI